LRLQGVCDFAGNLLTTFTSGFTTSASSTTDTTKPTVTITPAQNATNVPVNTQIVLTFSEPVDATTLANGLHANFGTGPIEDPGTISISGSTVTFTPAEPFPGNTFVSFNVTGIADLAGNVITNVTRNFTTGAPGDTTPPQVISMVPNDGLVDVA